MTHEHAAGHGHHHAHDAHGHRHGHAQAPRNFGAAFAVGTVLNTGFIVIEVVYGVLAHSTALLADAGHNLSDVLALLIAWGAAHLGTRGPTERFTYGFRSTSILAALINAVVLLFVMGAIAWEAIRRFAEPEPVVGLTVMIVAAIGIAVNGLTAWLFAAGRDSDLNIKAAFVHMVGDAVISAGVVVAGGLILLTHWLWLDPAVSLVLVGVVVWSTWGLLRDSLMMSLDAVPSGIKPAEVRAYLQQLPGVKRIHDLHIWPMSTTEVALTCHLLMPDGHPGDEFSVQTARELHAHFGIGHTTLQIEVDEAVACALEPEHLV
ncbi:MAG TPA: cation diffusion facilitator family transporter [Stellaceae bacterium]|nr:cation diffusion facilitator family transporter [Stellaceae bacterium]